MFICRRITDPSRWQRHQITVPIFKEGKWKGVMSAIGTKQTWTCALQMSAFGGKADIAPASQNVRLCGDRQ